MTLLQLIIGLGIGVVIVGTIAFSSKSGVTVKEKPKTPRPKKKPVGYTLSNIEPHLEIVYKHSDPRQEATPQKTHPYKYCPEVECSSCIFVEECNYVKPVPERDM